MNILRTDYSGSGKWKAIADFMNKVGRAVNGITGIGCEVHAVGDQIRIEVEKESAANADNQFSVFKNGASVSIRFGRVIVSIPHKPAVAGMDWFTGTDDYDLRAWIDGGVVCLKYYHSCLSGGVPQAGGYNLVYTADPDEEGSPEPEYDIIHLATTNADGTITQHRTGPIYITDARRGHTEIYIGNVGSLPDHFGIVDDAWLPGAFPVFYSSADTDYAAIGAHGGFKWHGPAENNHTDHVLAHTHSVTPAAVDMRVCNCIGTEVTIYAWADVPTIVAGTITWTGTNGEDGAQKHAGTYGPSTANVDNRPPWFVVALIRRL